ncbi:acyl-CoA dehydrogenase family protein [Rubrobacter aplysinae]|uniref:acyl-CoA dehydrogenase family protein n=1 Tax=Rubrobacter aplysinae TaxID=909625 RepID=UPI00064BD2D8|nr:acyl-CoA dehydrogenase family protein [Rubrobacter aplysinae]
MTMKPESVRGASGATDFIGVDRLLTDEEREMRDRTRAFVDERVIPVAADYWDRAEFPFELLEPLGELGVLGATFDPEYGGSGVSNVAYGLAIAELARGSGSLSTFLHVQSGLAMAAIHSLGSEDQKGEWLPGLARCEKIGCFGLTEPDAGSDPGSMKTTATPTGDGYVLNGEKKWIGNGSFSDVAVIWARISGGEDDGRISGFLVRGDAAGYDAGIIPRKGSQRAVWQTHITLTDCHVPEQDRLPGAKGLGSTLSVLAHSRYGVAWDGLGQATDCYETALTYATEREQFGHALASFQLTQQKLVEMVNEISQMQLLSIQIGRLKDDGEMTAPQVSMHKMNNLNKARRIAATARDALGGNGVLLDYRVMEHMADIEGVYSYEGTNDVNTLIVGQAITGHKAFSPAPAKNPEKNGRAERAEEKPE